MRYKGLSVCGVALLVFFGMRLLMGSVAPPPPSHLAMLDGDTRTLPSRNHLASYASIAAAALTFAVVPGRRRSLAERIATARTHLATAASWADTARTCAATIPGRLRSLAPKPATLASVPEPVLHCPRCERTMNRVLIATGDHRGRTVWLCPQSPDCEVRPLARRRLRRLAFLHRAS